MHNVMAKQQAKDRLNIRIPIELKEDAVITADLKGMKLSGLVKHLLKEAVRTEQARDMRPFIEPRRSQLLEVLMKEQDENGNGGGNSGDDISASKGGGARLPSTGKKLGRKKLDKKREVS